MTKRDMIFISALINMGLLAILFAFATIGEEDDMVPLTPAKEEMPPIAQNTRKTPPQPLPVDEVDQTIRRYFPEMVPP
ncbi:MAG: hypothetical protein KDK65_02165, partial [Chlamydiia bacterium]|nr:hypothetical protein [Chlamydiia bacterium]